MDLWLKYMTTAMIGGYKSLTAAFRKCRSCMAIDADMQTKVCTHKYMELFIEYLYLHAVPWEGVCTADPWNPCLSLLQPWWSNTWTYCHNIWSYLWFYPRFFHVVDGIVPDIMHDILQLHLKWLLSSQILEEKMYSLRTLNDRIQSFSYGPVDSPNRPTTISHDTLSATKRNNVKQSCKSIIVHCC